MDQAQEVELVKKAQAGCSGSLQILIEKNRKLIRRIASKVGKGMDIDDAISEGVIGIIISLPKFEIDRGYRFHTYARYHIADSIRKASQRASLVRIPRSNSNLEKTKQAQKLFRKTGSVNIQGLMESGLSPKEAKDAVMMYSHQQSGTYQNIDDAYNLADDGINLEEYLDINQKREILSKAKDVLNERERYIIDTRTAANDDPLTLNELGAIYGIGSERVRQIEERAMAKLMKKLEEMGVIQAAA